MTAVRLGIYRHYKGDLYELIGTARHSEDLSEMAVYRQCCGARGLWVRPLAMFLETIEVDGAAVSRFAFVGEA